MERVRVVGMSGSGKSTVAREIGRRLGMPHLELDAVYWLPGWQERSSEEFRAIVVDFAAGERWVIDGNYNRHLGDHLDHLVDTYVWLDLPRWRVMVAVVGRTVRRGVTREQLWGTGNTERVTSLLRRAPEDNIALWAWTRHASLRGRYAAMAATVPHRWIRLHSRREMRRFLTELTTSPPTVRP